MMALSPVCRTAAHRLRINLLLVCTVCKYRSMYISIEHTTYILALYYIVQHVSHCMANMAT